MTRKEFAKRASEVSKAKTVGFAELLVTDFADALGVKLEEDRELLAHFEHCYEHPAHWFWSNGTVEYLDVDSGDKIKIDLEEDHVSRWVLERLLRDGARA